MSYTADNTLPRPIVSEPGRDPVLPGTDLSFPMAPMSETEIQLIFDVEEIEFVHPLRGKNMSGMKDATHLIYGIRGGPVLAIKWYLKENRWFLVYDSSNDSGLKDRADAYESAISNLNKVTSPSAWGHDDWWEKEFDRSNVDFLQ